MLEIRKGGETVSAEKDAQRDLLKLFAFGTLASLWVNLGTTATMDEREASALLELQESLIKEFDSTLQAYLDEASMKTYREYVTKFKVRIS